MISLGIMTVTQLSLNFTEVIEEFPIVVRRRIFDEIKVIEKQFAKEKLCGEIQMKTDRFISPEQAVMFLTKLPAVNILMKMVCPLRILLLVK